MSSPDYDHDAAVQQMLDKVADRDSFFAFARELAADFSDSTRKEKNSPSSSYEAQANGWENIAIDTFLDAALSCGEDAGDKFSAEPSWKAFAEFLYWGKVYE